MGQRCDDVLAIGGAQQEWQRRRPTPARGQVKTRVAVPFSCSPNSRFNVQQTQKSLFDDRIGDASASPRFAKQRCSITGWKKSHLIHRSPPTLSWRSRRASAASRQGLGQQWMRASSYRWPTGDALRSVQRRGHVPRPRDEAPEPLCHPAVSYWVSAWSICVTPRLSISSLRGALLETGSRVQIAGARAAKALGLSTQVANAFATSSGTGEEGAELRMNLWKIV